MPWSRAGTACGIRALTPDAVMRKPMLSPAPTGSTASVPPRGIAWPAMINRLSSNLTRFFGNNTRGRFQASLVLSSSMKACAMARASPRSTCALGEAAELQARRRRPRAPLDEIEREGLGLLVAVFLLQHFESVDDRAGRADQIVANART